jgi:outer membrane receptor protein involved in Fe transport
LQDPNDLTRWDNYVTKNRKITEPHQNEFSLFFKDDWKLLPSLTLNLGLRYEYYGVPYEGQGLTAVPAGGGISLFGVSGRSFEHWMRPDNPVDLNLQTVLEFVGPKTKNPDKTIYKNDWNNFGPAVGFAWQLPWFGKGKTNVRGGYQITYQGGGGAGNFSNAIFSNQGFVFRADTQGPTDGTYFELRNLPGVIPIPTTVLPMQPIPMHKANVSGWAFDYNYVAPYIQNFTLSVTRDISRNLNLDVRYIGTRGVKLRGDIDFNSPNVYYNQRLFDALERTRRGENVELFDQMFMGLNLNPDASRRTRPQPAFPSTAPHSEDPSTCG